MGGLTECSASKALRHAPALRSLWYADLNMNEYYGDPELADLPPQIIGCGRKSASGTFGPKVHPTCFDV